MPSEMSVPVTWPLGPTAVAAASVTRPVPHATSSTRSPGWQRLRYLVTVESPAPETDVVRVIEHADARSPLLADFRDPLAITREVRITHPVEA